MRKLSLIDEAWAVDKSKAAWMLYGPLGQVPTREEWLELRSRVDAFYAETTDEEIADHNEEAKRNLYAKPEHNKPVKIEKDNAGWVYMLKGINTPWFKIGVAKDMRRRFDQISPVPPFEIEVVHKVWVADAYLHEARWHERFDNERTNGEWFELTDDQVDEFVRWA